MRTADARLPPQFLFEQIFDDGAARAEIVALRIDKPEDIRIMAFVADVELRRPMAQLLGAQLPALDLVDGGMRLESAVVAFEPLDESVEQADALLDIHEFS